MDVLEDVQHNLWTTNCFTSNTLLRDKEGYTNQLCLNIIKGSYKVLFIRAFFVQ